jgi:hypothetical protein
MKGPADPKAPKDCQTKRSYNKLSELVRRYIDAGIENEMDSETVANNTCLNSRPVPILFDSQP